MQPTPAEIKLKIYAAVTSALVEKYPTRSEIEFKSIAKTARKITEELLNEYLNPKDESE